MHHKKHLLRSIKQLLWIHQVIWHGSTVVSFSKHNRMLVVHGRHSKFVSTSIQTMLQQQQIWQYCSIESVTMQVQQQWQDEVSNSSLDIQALPMYSIGQKAHLLRKYQMKLKQLLQKQPTKNQRSTLLWKKRALKMQKPFSQKPHITILMAMAISTKRNSRAPLES